MKKDKQKILKHYINGFLKRYKKWFIWIGFSILDLAGFIFLTYILGVTQNKIWIYVIIAYLSINIIKIAKITKRDLKIIVVICVVIAIVIILCINVYGEISKVLYFWSGIPTETWLNFLGALSGSVLAVYGAYLVTDIQKKQEKKENDEYAKAIIDTFILREIENNINELDDYTSTTVSGKERKNKKTFDKYMRDGLKTDYYYNHDEIYIEEFNKIKYELIKYKSNDVKNAVLIYEMFSIIKKADNIAKLNENEFNRVRQIYLEYTK